MNALFEAVVLSTGISALFANKAIARACERAGVDPDGLSPKSLKLALPEIEKTVRTFCNDEVPEIMGRLSRLAQRREFEAFGAFDGEDARTENPFSDRHPAQR